MLFDEPTEPAPKGKPAAQKEQPSQLFSEEDESNDDAILDQSFLDDLLAGASEDEAPREEKIDLRARAEAALRSRKKSGPREAVAASSKSEVAVVLPGRLFLKSRKLPKNSSAVSSPVCRNISGLLWNPCCPAS